MMSGNVDLTSVGGVTLDNAALSHGAAAVVTAGTAVPLSASTVVLPAIYIKALAGNTGIVYVGSSSVDEDNGVELAAGEALLLTGRAPASVYIDCESGNTDAVRWIAA